MQQLHQDKITYRVEPGAYSDLFRLDSEHPRVNIAEGVDSFKDTHPEAQRFERTTSTDALLARVKAVIQSSDLKFVQEIASSDSRCSGKEAHHSRAVRFN